MMNLESFDRYTPSHDKFANQKAVLKLDDLQPAFSGEPKISYFISTYNRQWQLARSLEALARQTFREFEILLMDDGSTQDIRAIADMFRPYLQIRYFSQDRPAWTSCPSRAYRTLLSHAKGEIIAIAHPEMMLDFEAMDIIYRGCNAELDEVEAHIWSLDLAEQWGDKYWVSLKPQFLEDTTADDVDWHTRGARAFHELPGLAAVGGFAGQNNQWHANKDEYPWWFVGATHRKNGIWSNLPVFRGHGLIDMWLCSYRRFNGYFEVTPRRPLCYHQPHLVTAIGIEGEMHDETRHARRVE